MLKKSMTALFTLLFGTTLAAAQDAKTIVNTVAKAMGLDQVKTLEYSGSGFEGTALGQAQSPTAGWPKFTVKSYTRYVDVNAGTGQQGAVRSRPADPATGLLPGGGGLAPTAENTVTTAINANGNWQQKLDVNMSPPVFLRLAAAAPNAVVSSRTVDGKRYRIVYFPAEAKAPSGIPYVLTGYINADNMIEKIETSYEEPSMIGDVLVEQTFSGYKDFGGVKFPARITQTRAGLSWTDLTVTDVKTNVAAPPPPAPPAGRGGAGGAAGAAGRGGDGRGAPAAGGAAQGGGGRGGAPQVSSRKLADGIFLITGGYRSVAVEMKDHVVMIEAPQNETTTSNIIAEVKKLFPSKPIRYVVNSHAHFDHSGGLRAAVAEGATIITHQMNKPLFERWFANSRTLVMPDKLAQSANKPKFEYMRDKKVLKDNVNTIELYHLRGALHGEDTIVAYLPKIKTVVEADAFNAPAANAPTPQNINNYEKLFAAELDRLRIDYTHVIPVHQPAGGDRDVTKADLLRNIGRGNYGKAKT